MNIRQEKICELVKEKKFHEYHGVIKTITL